MVLADSHRLPLIPCYLGRSPGSHAVFAYRTFTSYGSAFQRIRLTPWFLTPRPLRNLVCKRPQHHRHNGCVLYCVKVRLFPFRSSLLRKSFLLFLPRGTEIFQFPPFALPHYEFSAEFRRMNSGGLPHSEIAGSKVVSPIRRLSQVTTSFIAFQCQGIHHMLLVT